VSPTISELLETGPADVGFDMLAVAWACISMTQNI
jgi:hypothetical protein